MGVVVAMDHGLVDLRLQHQEALDPGRRDIVPARQHDDVLLAVGDLQPPGLVDDPDVTGVQPAVDHRPAGVIRPLPIAVHDVLAAHQDKVVDLQQSFMPDSDSIVRSEVDALQSRTLVNRVIDRESLMDDPEFRKAVCDAQHALSRSVSRG